MSSDLRELYQEMILDHGKRPRNFRELASANRRADGYNPLCGDRETVYLELEGDVVRDIAFQGAGCAISTAFSPPSSSPAAIFANRNLPTDRAPGFA